MMNRTMTLVLALSLMLMFSGCDEKAEASSVSQETASSAASVSSSVSADIPAEEETVLPLLSSDNGERVYALEGSRQDNIWSTRYYWINEDRMLLFRKENAQA